MIRIYAHFYIYIGRVFQYWMQKNSGSPDQLSEDDHKGYRKALGELISHCQIVVLPVSETLIADALNDAKPETSYLAVGTKMGELQRCVDAEIRSRLFFLIPYERSRYLIFVTDDEGDGIPPHVGQEIRRFAPVLDKFGSIVLDLEDAGQCFATGSFTACVYHLMRVSEYGLVSLAVNLGADPGVSSWEKLLRKIDIKISEFDKTHPEGWEQDRTFYSEAAALMINVKNSWRNSVSHIRRSYDEQRARRIFNSVEALMQHLASRLSESPLPPTSQLLEPDLEAPSALPSD